MKSGRHLSRREGDELMADKPLRSLNGKKFKGVLAEPIDHGLYMPLTQLLQRDDQVWRPFLRARARIMSDQRRAKMPALAEHLGIDLKIFNLSDPSNGTGLLFLYTAIAENLAGLVVPGFMEKPRGKHSPEIVEYTRLAADLAKTHGKVACDLDFCREIIKIETPDLARPGRKSELEKKAKTLRNLIARDRASAARARLKVRGKPRLVTAK
jgi:hypothetical protein